MRNDGDLILRDCGLVANETSGSGGGLYAGPRSITSIEACEITDNRGEGGGLFTESATL